MPSRTMPAFIEPELAKLLERPPEGPGWAHEMKLDGYRIQLRVARGQVQLLTRKALDWSGRFPEITHAAQVLPDCIVDGEIVVLDERGISDFAALQAALSTDTRPCLYCAFDLLYQEGADLRRLPLRERRERLQPFLAAHLRNDEFIRYLGYIDSGHASSGAAVLDTACEMGLEGILCKQMEAPYRSGRTGDWIKVKCRLSQEVVLGGWTSVGKKLSSLIAGVFRNGELVPVGLIGTGYGAEAVNRLMPHLRRMASSHSPFATEVSIPSGRILHWLKPTLVAQIEAAGWTHDGQLRQAAFKGLREDKPAREVHAETPSDEPPAKPIPQHPPASARRRSHRSPPMHPDTLLSVSLTHPDKVLWPGDAQSITKEELARYYVDIARWLLPYVAGRPCAIVRAPDGITGSHIFQRHPIAGMSQRIGKIILSKDQAPYLLINSVEALVAVAQSGGVELHPGNCLPGEPEVVGRLVFDIDPSPELPFDAVVGAARELRERLEDLGFTAFCKTTGGKGLHVVTPVSESTPDPAPWDKVRAYAREICAEMVADSPDTYVLSSAKQARTGRIFLDYLRNDRHATAVAVLSPRARPGAPVSMPLLWNQVRKGLDPSRFTLRTALAQLNRNDPWADFDQAARPFPRLEQWGPALRLPARRVSLPHAGR